MEIMRASELWQQAGAFSVRIQGMGRQHHISLRDEFDDHDGQGTKYIVLLDDEYPIATCRFYEIANSAVMLGRVVVLPEYRGNGLGKTTIEEAEKWITELGYKKIVIESRKTVVDFYTNLGYTLDDEEIIEGPTFRCLKMHKDLS